MPHYHFPLKGPVALAAQEEVLEKIRKKYQSARYDERPPDWPCAAMIRVATAKCTPEQSLREHVKIRKHVAACLKPHKVSMEERSFAIY